MRLLKKISVTLRHRSQTYAKGHLVTTITSEETIQASLQPLSSRELELLPEGKRERGSFLLVAHQEFKTSDSVIARGEEYEIFKVDGPWEAERLNYWEATLLRLEPAEASED